MPGLVFAKTSKAGHQCLREQKLLDHFLTFGPIAEFSLFENQVLALPNSSDAAASLQMPKTEQTEPRHRLGDTCGSCISSPKMRHLRMTLTSFRLVIATRLVSSRRRLIAARRVAGDEDRGPAAS